jgi:hypothetical protein
MESAHELFPTGAASQLTQNGGVIILLWLAAGLAAVFVFYLVIHPLVMWHKRRRAAARASAINELHESFLLGTSGRGKNDYLETACSQCETAVFVAEGRRYEPFFCPNCGQTNPPFKKDLLAWGKRFLRKLLYPSFQDRI